ncbi:hypothetical protein JCM8547_002402 [Rhodosporidiobolus lusitaniae]
MYSARQSAFGDRERSFSAGSVPLASASPAGRTIYSNSAPTSPYNGYQRVDVPRTYTPVGMPTMLTYGKPEIDLVFLAEPVFCQPQPPAPCSCADCYSSAPTYASHPHRTRTANYESYASTSTFVDPSSSLPYPPATFPPDQPVYLPVARRPDSASYYSAPPPVLSPPVEENLLPVPDPLYYNIGWTTQPLPSSSSSYHLQPLDRAPLYERPALGYQPQLFQQTSPGLLAPLPVKHPLDRRRSSGETTRVEQVVVRRGSAMSLGARSMGSEEGDGEEQHETTTPFMSKLHFLLNNPEFQEVIRWNAAGNAFVFAQTTQELAGALGRVFRHSSSHSFARQLNIYDFKRMTQLELHTAVESAPFPGSILTSADFAGFSHPLFFRDTPELTCNLAKIKPKMGKKPSSRNLAAAQVADAGRTRSLRSDRKVGGGMRGRKI